MELFFKELRYKIQQAVKTDFQRILREVGEEKIYSVAFVTDSDCITLYLAVNTYEYMKEKDNKYIKLFQSRLTQEKIENIKNHSISITKWTPAEWGYSDGKNSELNKISKLLYAKQESLNSNEYPRYTELFFEIVTSVFKQLILSKVFEENSEEITYFISMSDDERTTEIENHSAKLLNSEAHYQDFLKRTEDWQ